MNIISAEVKTMYQIEITKGDIRKILWKARKDETEEILYDRIFDFLRAESERMPGTITEETVQDAFIKIALNNIPMANYVSRYFGMECEHIGYYREADQVWVMLTSKPGDQLKGRRPWIKNS